MLCRSAAQQEHYGKKAAAEHGLQFYKHHCRKVSHAADWQRGLRAHKHCPPCGPPKGRPLALRAPGCQEGILSKAVTGKATRSQRHEMPCRGLHLLKAALSRSAGSRIPLARPRRPRHRLRPYLHLQKEKQRLHRPGRTRLGIKEVDEGIRLVSFIDDDLGYIDLEQRALQPIDNPFGPRLSPMS